MSNLTLSINIMSNTIMEALYLSPYRVKAFLRLIASCFSPYIALFFLFSNLMTHT